MSIYRIALSVEFPHFRTFLFIGSNYLFGVSILAQVFIRDASVDHLITTAMRLAFLTLCFGSSHTTKTTIHLLLQSIAFSTLKPFSAFRFHIP